MSRVRAKRVSKNTTRRSDALARQAGGVFGMLQQLWQSATGSRKTPCWQAFVNRHQGWKVAWKIHIKPQDVTNNSQAWAQMLSNILQQSSPADQRVVLSQLHNMNKLLARIVAVLDYPDSAPKRLNRLVKILNLLLPIEVSFSTITQYKDWRAQNKKYIHHIRTMRTLAKQAVTFSQLLLKDESTVLTGQSFKINQSEQDVMAVVISPCVCFWEPSIVEAVIRAMPSAADWHTALRNKASYLDVRSLCFLLARFSNISGFKEVKKTCAVALAGAVKRDFQIKDNKGTKQRAVEKARHMLNLRDVHIKQCFIETLFAADDAQDELLRALLADQPGCAYTIWQALPELPRASLITVAQSWVAMGEVMTQLLDPATTDAEKAKMLVFLAPVFDPDVAVADPAHIDAQLLVLQQCDPHGPWFTMACLRPSFKAAVCDQDSPVSKKLLRMQDVSILLGLLEKDVTLAPQLLLKHKDNFIQEMQNAKQAYLRFKSQHPEVSLPDDFDVDAANALASLDSHQQRLYTLQSAYQQFDPYIGGVRRIGDNSLSLHEQETRNLIINQLDVCVTEDNVSLLLGMLQHASYRRQLADGAFTQHFKKHPQPDQ